MNAPHEQTAVICSACGGDPRASKNCRVCGGAGIGVASPDGFLVWTEPVDAFHITLRRLKHRVTTMFHVALFTFILMTWVALVYGIASQPSLADVFDLTFWFGGHWFVTLYGFGLLTTCFLVFRFREYGHEEKTIPVSQMTRKEQETYDADTSRANHRFDVAPYYSKEARDIVESAWKITKDLRRTQVLPEMVFAATLTSPTGGLLMARLGLSFDDIKRDLARHMAEVAPAGDPPIVFSREVKRVLALAYASARQDRRPHVSPTELFLQSFAASADLQKLMNRHGFPPEHVTAVGEWIRLRQGIREDHTRFVQLARLKPQSSMNRSMTARQAPLLESFSDDLTRAALRGQLASPVGRGDVFQSVFQAIEGGANGVILVGDTGVGKTAIIEGLARKMVEEDVPNVLFDKRLVSIHVEELLVGAPADASTRILDAMSEVRDARNVVLVLEGIEALAGSGGSMDLADILANELERGGILVIGTTTPRGWTEFLERSNLGSRLVRVPVQSLNIHDAVRAAMARTAYMERKQDVFFSYASLERAATLAERYLRDVASPQNLIEILREAAVAAKKERGAGAVVSSEDVEGVVHAKTNIPVQDVTKSETEKLLKMEELLHARIIGQDEAVSAVAKALRRARSEIREGKKPIASFLFLGPTGVGKTELSKALAAEYFGDEDMMVRIDMSEYQDPSSVSRMIGASGDERGGLLTEAVRKQPFALLLCDEVEKAHPDILNLFLQVLDDGRLTDGVGRTVDFTNTMIIMTSNAGTAFIQSEVAKGTAMERIRTMMLERELKGVFRPEFLNRFDGIIVFSPLSTEDVLQITKLELQKVAARLKEKGMEFRVEDEAVRLLATEGYDPLFGARPLKRVIQERVDDQLADILLRKEADRGDTIVLHDDGGLGVER